jgi:RNA polymerase sigma-54 factor
MRMELGLSQHQTIKQIQTLSPQMYMSMEILCLNSLDLTQRIQEEMENNETLERVEPTAGDGQEMEGSGAEGMPEGGAATLEPATSDDLRSFEERVEQWDQYSREEYGTSRLPSSYRGEKDEKLEALSNTEGRPVSLQEHLEEQVHLLGDDEIVAVAHKLLPATNGPRAPLTAEEVVRVRDLCLDIIYNINNRGYLMYSLEEIQASLDQKPGELHPPSEPLQVALAVVQGLEPAGIAGRDLKECLLLQLRRDRQDYPIEERIIQDHLEDLGHNRLPKIARALGITIEEVKEATHNIASLNPIPGKLFGSEAPRYVRPDVVVDEIEGRYEVRVESDYVPRLQISPHYRALYKESGKNPEVKKYLKKKMDNAEWLLAAIRQRQSTLQKIAQEIVNIQSEFLDHGITHLKPLKMADVAERLGVHVSTISRAISGKYMQSPRGIFELKFFFTGGATKTDGEVEARGSVIQRIKDFIAEEDKRNPLSDITIVRKLEEVGIKISRRTVTKYREAEGIPSSRERRSY